MTVIKKETGMILVGSKRSSVAQLFNSFEPAPSREKETRSRY